MSCCFLVRLLQISVVKKGPFFFFNFSYVTFQVS